jgi:hypothetical protein
VLGGYRADKIFLPPALTMLPFFSPLHDVDIGYMN